MIVVYEKGFFGSGQGTLKKLLFLKDGMTLREVWNKAVAECPEGYEINSIQTGSTARPCRLRGETRNEKKTA